MLLVYGVSGEAVHAATTAERKVTDSFSCESPAPESDTAKRACGALHRALGATPLPPDLILRLSTATDVAIEGQLVWRGSDGATREGPILSAGSLDAPLDDKILESFARAIVANTKFDK